MNYLPPPFSSPYSIAGVANPLTEADREAKKKKTEESKKESQPKDSSRKRKLGAFEEVLKVRANILTMCTSMHSTACACVIVAKVICLLCNSC